MKNLQRRFPLIRRYVLGVLLPVPLFFALGAQPQAAVVYTYTGTNFTSIFNSDPFPAGTYDNTMRVTGSFTVAAPLASLPMFTDITASVLSYSFSDGRQTLDNGNSLLPIFTMGTTGEGDPTSWWLQAYAPYPNPSIVGDFSRSIISENEGFTEDRTIMSYCTIVIFNPPCLSGGQIDQAFTDFTAGTWTSSPAVVPLPPAVLLLGSALVALFGLGRVGSRRRRQA